MHSSLNVADHGLAIFPDILTSAETELLGEELADSQGGHSRAGLRHALRQTAVRNIASDPRLIGIAPATLGPDAMPFTATLFSKTPNANWLVVWHQDTALPIVERREIAGW